MVQGWKHQLLPCRRTCLLHGWQHIQLWRWPKHMYILCHNSSVHLLQLLLDVVGDNEKIS